MSDLDRQKNYLYSHSLSNNASIEILTALQCFNAGFMGAGISYFAHHYPKPKSAVGFLGASYAFYTTVSLQVRLNEHLDEQWRLEQQLNKIKKYIYDYKKKS